MHRVIHRPLTRDRRGCAYRCRRGVRHLRHRHASPDGELGDPGGHAGQAGPGGRRSGHHRIRHPSFPRIVLDSYACRAYHASVIRRPVTERRDVVTFLKGMNEGEVLAYCSGILAAQGASHDGVFTRPEKPLFHAHKHSHRRRPKPIRTCACGDPIPPPGPRGGHPRKWCRDDCPKRSTTRTGAR